MLSARGPCARGFVTLAVARALLDRVQGRDGADAPVLTIGQERERNTFFRLGSASVRDGLQRAFEALPAALGHKEVFLLFRQLRNRW